MGLAGPRRDRGPAADPGRRADQTGIGHWVTAGRERAAVTVAGPCTGRLAGGINAWWTGARGAARPWGRATGSAGTAAPLRGDARRVVSPLSRATGFAMRAGTRWLSWRRPHR